MYTNLIKIQVLVLALFFSACAKPLPCTCPSPALPTLQSTRPFVVTMQGVDLYCFDKADIFTLASNMQSCKALIRALDNNIKETE